MKGLLDALVALGDDALVLGQRLCQWCGKAPMLEEDLAMANTALDLLGRARLFYAYAEQLGGRSEDHYAFHRDAREFRNLLLYELPGADFAAAYARQFLVDVFDDLHCALLAGSRDETLAGIGAKAHKEARYHRRHSTAWLVRLGTAHRKAAAGCNRLWRMFGAIRRSCSSMRKGRAPWLRLAFFPTAPRCGRDGGRRFPLRCGRRRCRRQGMAGASAAAGRVSILNTSA